MTRIVIEKYLKENLNKNYTKKQLIENLIKSGYTQEDINYVFKKINFENNRKPKKNNDLLLRIFFIVILFFSGLVLISIQDNTYKTTNGIIIQSEILQEFGELELHGSDKTGKIEIYYEYLVKDIKYNSSRIVTTMERTSKNYLQEIKFNDLKLKLVKGNEIKIKYHKEFPNKSEAITNQESSLIKIISVLLLILIIGLIYAIIYPTKTNILIQQYFMRSHKKY
jgi:hypothetical protein